MVALPLMDAILVDLICGTGNEVIQDGGRKRKEMRSSRWRPEAEGPPFSAATAIGVEKFSLYYSQVAEKRVALLALSCRVEIKGWLCACAGSRRMRISSAPETSVNSVN